MNEQDETEFSFSNSDDSSSSSSSSGDNEDIEGKKVSLIVQLPTIEEEKENMISRKQSSLSIVNSESLTVLV